MLKSSSDKNRGSINKGYVLGVDAGGTKTHALVADAEGLVLGMGRSGGGNFQSSGVRGASESINSAITLALEQARVERTQVSAACYGIAGADRKKDFRTIKEFLMEITPTPRFILVNDTVIALRAGTSDGVGIGLIAGTSNNAIGMNRKKRIAKVGGLGRPMGDFGSASDIGEYALFSAMRGHDGRGRPTILYKKLCRLLGVKKLEDAIEFLYYDNIAQSGGSQTSSLGWSDFGALAFLVFEAAREGDRVAQGILKKAGKEIARAASVVMKKLFRPNEDVPIVMGGSVFQRGNHPALVRSLRANLPKNYRKIRMITLDFEPVLGAIFFCLDRLYGKAGEERMIRAKESFHSLEKPLTAAS